ncbi:MAG: YgjP-like metallopeptidase domain-containing protein [Bilophila sp.]
MAHVREHNHSKRYYAVLEQLLPEWKTVRSELETLAPLLLNR